MLCCASDAIIGYCGSRTLVACFSKLAKENKKKEGELKKRMRNLPSTCLCVSQVLMIRLKSFQSACMKTMFATRMDIMIDPMDLFLGT
jgi:hypothetical protein